MPSPSMGCTRAMTTYLVSHITGIAMKYKFLVLITTLALSLGLFNPANATLFSRLGGAAAYDDVLDITWVTDAALGGLDTWNNQLAWVDGLDYLGFDDWRLATAFNLDGSGPCNGFNCTGSEMGHMFYNNLGGIASSSKTGDQTSVDGVDFFDIQFRYWSPEEEVVAGLDTAWTFAFSTGRQFRTNKDLASAAWAVRDGDIAAAPEPSTMLLMATDFAGLGFASRKKRMRKNQ